MDTRERIGLFSEQIMCGADIYTWHYNEKLELQGSNCPEEEVLDEVLFNFGAKDSLIRYVRDGIKPIVISIPIGLIWCAAIDPAPEKPELYLIGPVWSSEAGMRPGLLLAEATRDREVDPEWRKRMAGAMSSLSTVMPKLMYQYALMLHCCLTGEKLSMSDLVFELAHSNTDVGEVQKDRYRIWNFEQALLRMVREGDPDYLRTFAKASNVSGGISLKSSDRLRSAKTSVTVFTALCTRAAIEGGMSPEMAYTLENNYLQAVENCRTLGNITSVSQGMYSDFTERVHAIRTGKDISAPIRALCDYIHLHLEEPLPAAALAARTGYSAEYLPKKFREEMKISLAEYIRTARVERAKVLLEEGELSISEIAEKLQFCSRGHFSEVFAAVAGSSPAEYRKKVKRT